MRIKKKKKSEVTPEKFDSESSQNIRLEQLGVIVTTVPAAVCELSALLSWRNIALSVKIVPEGYFSSFFFFLSMLLLFSPSGGRFLRLYIISFNKANGDGAHRGCLWQ